MRRTSMAMAMWMVGLSMAQAATIRGTIAPADRVSKIEALLRGKASMAKLNIRRFPGKIDADAGTFVIEGLPNGAYDLAVTLAAAGVVLEGIDLGLDEDDTRPGYLLNVSTRSLATRNFDVSQYFDPDAVVTDAERLARTMSKLRIGKLEAKIASLLKVSRFTNVNRPLWIRGSREEALVLMELIRDRKFHSGGDEIIFRAEIWPFRWEAGGWDKPRKGTVVVERIRTTRAKFGAMTRLFDPALGGLRIADDNDLTGVNYKLPAKLDASMGVVARPKR